MTPGRRLAAISVALVLAALGLWVSTRLVWVNAVFDVPLRGQVPVQVHGGDLQPALLPIALLALAAVAGAVATGGVLRQLIGAVIVAAGGWTAWLGAAALLAAPSADRLAALPDAPAGGALAGAPSGTAAPLAAIVAGLLLVGAGVVLIGNARRLPRLSGRYAARQAPRRPVGEDQQLWEQLDAGQDPTR